MLRLAAFVFVMALCHSTGADSPAPEPLVGMTLTLTKQGGEQVPLHTEVFDNEDAAAATVRVCYDTHNLDHSLAASIWKHLQGKLDEAKHKPTPEGVDLLRTAGAYTRRAKEHAKDGEHKLGAADILRALSRQGLEQEARDNMMRQLQYSFESMRRMKDREAKEAAEEEKRIQNKALEAEALEEAKRRRSLEDQDWKAFATKLSVPEETRPVIANMPLTVTMENNGEKEQTQKNAMMIDGEDAAYGAFLFCASADIRNADQVKQVADMLKQKGDEAGYDSPFDDQSAETHLQRAENALRDGYFLKAGVEASRALVVGDGADVKSQISGKSVKQLLVEAMSHHIATTNFITDFNAGNCEKVFNAVSLMT